MKNVMKNIVLCLLGIVMMATLMTPVTAANTVTLLNQAVTINDDSENLPVSFTITTDDATALPYTNPLKIVVTGGTTNILTSATITLDKNVEKAESKLYTVMVPVDNTKTVAGQTYTVTVKITDGATPAIVVVNDKPITITVAGTDTAAAQSIIDDVEFEDKLAPGDEVDVEIALKTAEGKKYNDVTVQAWITDEDGDRVTDKEETKDFNIGSLSDEDEETKTLTLSIPKDADEGDYYLNIRVEGEYDGRSGLLAVVSKASTGGFDNKLTVERDDHSILIDSINYDASVKAGETADFAISLQNNGNDDEDVKVKISIVGLDVAQTSGNIEVEVDETVPAYFSLLIPKNAKADDYTVKINVYGDEVDFTETYELTVAGAGAGPAVTGLVVGTDATSKQIGAAGGVYLVTLTNNDAATRTFTLDVTGASTWADYSINPATATVAPGTSAVVSVYLNPSATARGTQSFTVNVKEGATVVDSTTLTAQIAEESASTTSMITMGLQYLVAILVVLAVVLGIAWAVKKEKKE